MVDGELGEQRSSHLRDGLQQQKNERNHHGSAVRFQVPHQPPHQPAIVHFSEMFFFHG
jgi:hypothetical protein